jgi:hypothetical protein
LRGQSDDERGGLERRLGDIHKRIELQVRAIEAGVDPSSVNALRRLRPNATTSRVGFREVGKGVEELAGLVDGDRFVGDFAEPRKALAAAEPELRRRVFDAFRPQSHSTATPSQ